MKTLNNDKIEGYKGFDKNLKCINFQYEIGKTYNYGFSFCENPIDVFIYYPPINNNRYCKVIEKEKY